MCGGLEIAPFSEELAGYFEDDKEIVLYKSEEEFVSKAKFFLNPTNNALCLQMKKMPENELKLNIHGHVGLTRCLS